MYYSYRLVFLALVAVNVYENMRRLKDNMDNVHVQLQYKTVVFDFDGVIHPYTTGWQGASKIHDAPVPGVKELLSRLNDAGLRVIIMSSRALDSEGKKAIVNYLKEYELWGLVDSVITEKIPALVYVDDRAICFTGKTEGLFEQIVDFKSWTDN